MQQPAPAPRPERIELGGMSAWTLPARPHCGPTQRTVVLLHGYGASRPVLLQRLRTLHREHCARTVIPQSPTRIRNGTRVWWPVSPTIWRSAAHTEEPTPSGMEEAGKRVVRFLRAARKAFGIQSKHIVLAGFSQGATLAVHVGQQLDQSLGALVLLGGRFMATHAWRGKPKPLRSTKTIVVHGAYDPISPYWAADYLRQSLEAAGTPVLWLPHRGGHRPSGWGPKVHHALAQALGA